MTGRVAASTLTGGTTVYQFIVVVSLIAVVTFVTGLLLPLGTRRSRDPDTPSPEDGFAAELAAGR